MKYDEQQKAEEWNSLVCFAIRRMQEDGTFNDDDPKREEKLERRRQKMKEPIEEAKDQLWNIRNEENFEEKS